MCTQAGVGLLGDRVADEYAPSATEVETGGRCFECHRLGQRLTFRHGSLVAVVVTHPNPTQRRAESAVVDSHDGTEAPVSSMTHHYLLEASDVDLFP